jgi:hypothetical protein
MTAIRVVHDASSFLLDLWEILDTTYYVLKNGHSQVEYDFYSGIFYIVQSIRPSIGGL